MRIGIDARMINHSGIGTFLSNTISRQQKVSDHEFVLFGKKQELEKDGIHVVEADYPIYGIKEQLFFPHKLNSAKLDLFHATHYNIPLFYRGNFVVTIYDLIHVVFPEYLPSKAAYYYANYMISSACKKAKKIITISEFTKKDLVKHYDVNPEKISVIYPAVSNEFSPLSSDSGKIRGKYGKYVLYVGAIREHKNVTGLVNSFCRLKRERVFDHKLVLIGKGKYKYISRINGIIRENDLQGEVVILNDINNSDIPDFYREAELFVFPSFYEGFGLPPLESMASGCPVITSNSSSLPEVVGDSAVLFDPYEKDGLYTAMKEIIMSEDKRQELREKGLERSKKFTWENTVEKILRVYDTVI
ncbi:glycosyltransferase family 4 protein [bacterium]|nr:glycosyltransferase family 4 protein [bacterium]